MPARCKLSLLHGGGANLTHAEKMRQHATNDIVLCVLLQTTAFGWSDGTNGLYVGCLCLAMLPGQWKAEGPAFCVRATPGSLPSTCCL